MGESLGIVLPVFALILCGYLVAWRGWVDGTALRGLSFFVYYMATPALLFRTVARSNVAEVLDFSLVAAFYGVSLALFFACVRIGRKGFGQGLKESAVMGMGATYSNMLLLGFPLVYTAFGDAGIVPLTMLIAFQAPILLSLASTLTEFDLANGGEGGRSNGGASRVRAMLRSLVRAVVRNPIVLGLCAGILFQISGFTMPVMLDRFTDLLGGAVVPCALFSLGVSLVGFRLTGDLLQGALIVFLKNLVHPAAVALVVYGLLDVPPLWAAVAVILAAQPAGLNVFILAQQYQVFTARAASVVLTSTALSIVTVTLLIAYYVNAIPQ